MPASSRSRSTLMRAVSASSSATASSRGDGESGSSGGVLSARAQPALLAAAVHERLELRLAGDDECPDAGRPAQFVRGDAQCDQSGPARAGLAAQRPERQRHVPERADGIHMQRHPGIRAGGGCRDHRLERADLVVGREKGRRRGVAAVDGTGPRVDIEPRIAVDRHPFDVGDFVRVQPRQRVDRGVVLRGRGDDRRPAGGLAAGPVQAGDAQIDRLCAAGGEHDLDRVAVQRSGEPLAGILEHPAGVLPGAVDR